PGSLGMVSLKGTLNRESSLAMKSILLKAMGRERHIVINLAEVERVEFECFRLLCDAHRTSVALNHHLSVIGSRADIFEQVVMDPAFGRSSRCINPEESSCYWLKEQDNMGQVGNSNSNICSVILL
ncbi:lipid asymmetry maintenance protein MlaB, partial [Nitrospirota bacterium]